MKPGFLIFYVGKHVPSGRLGCSVGRLLIFSSRRRVVRNTVLSSYLSSYPISPQGWFSFGCCRYLHRGSSYFPWDPLFLACSHPCNTWALRHPTTHTNWMTGTQAGRRAEGKFNLSCFFSAFNALNTVNRSFYAASLALSHTRSARMKVPNDEEAYLYALYTRPMQRCDKARQRREFELVRPQNRAYTVLSLQ